MASSASDSARAIIGRAGPYVARVCSCRPGQFRTGHIDRCPAAIPLARFEHGDRTPTGGSAASRRDDGLAHPGSVPVTSRPRSRRTLRTDVDTARSRCAARPRHRSRSRERLWMDVAKQPTATPRAQASARHRGRASARHIPPPRRAPDLPGRPALADRAARSASSAPRPARGSVPARQRAGRHGRGPARCRR